MLDLQFADANRARIQKSKGPPPYLRCKFFGDSVTNKGVSRQKRNQILIRNGRA